MVKPTRIHRGKQPRRPHHIPEWATYRGYSSQQELADALGVDKGTVSRWYDGACPQEDTQERIAALFHCDRESLFKSPEEEWLHNFILGRPKEEVERIKVTLETAFPKRASTA